MNLHWLRLRENIKVKWFLKNIKIHGKDIIGVESLQASSANTDVLFTASLLFHNKDFHGAAGHRIDIEIAANAQQSIAKSDIAMISFRCLTFQPKEHKLI